MLTAGSSCFSAIRWMTLFLVDALHLFYTLIKFLLNSSSTSTHNFYLICFSTGNQKRMHSNTTFCRRSAVILLITVSTMFLRYPFCSCLSSPVNYFCKVIHRNPQVPYARNLSNGDFHKKFIQLEKDEQ